MAHRTDRRRRVSLNAVRAALWGAAMIVATTAHAEMKQYNVGIGLGFISPYAEVGSRDGYHLWVVENRGEKDVLEKDGTDFARSAKGGFVHSDSFMAKGIAASSGDGRILLHLAFSLDANGDKTVSAAINGKPTGSAYSEIKDLRVSPNGTNVAYAGHDATGWSVHSAEGAGPSLPDPPAFLFVSDAETLYAAHWQGRMWLYRDGKPTAAPNYTAMSASDDLKRVAGVYADPRTGKTWVDVDGTANGPWESAQAPVFSDDGRHYAFVAMKPGSANYDTVVVDGGARPVSAGADYPLVDDAGVAYWTIQDEKAGTYAAYRDGVKLGTFRGRFNHRWAAASPSGGHYAAWIAGKLIVDGKVAETAPAPGDGLSIAFDGEREFHYISTELGLKLVCVTVDGSPAESTRCAKVGEAMDRGPRRAVLAEPALAR